MRICPDCGEPLVKVTNAERLYQCENTGLYYPVTREGKLGEPLTNPPQHLLHQQPQKASPLPRVTRTTSTLPPRLHMELANKIGEDQIPNFIEFLESELNMKPFDFMMQPNKLKDDVMSRAFPHWLGTKGLV